MTQSEPTIFEKLQKKLACFLHDGDLSVGRYDFPLKCARVSVPV